jgi:hypothetical protein
MFMLRGILVGIGWQKVAFICGLIIVALLQIASFFVSTAIISGVTAIIVVQLSVAPLRPVRLREAMGVLKKRLRPFLNTMILFLIRCSSAICFYYSRHRDVDSLPLYAPVVLIEGLEKKAALKRLVSLVHDLANGDYRFDSSDIDSPVRKLTGLGVSDLVAVGRRAGYLRHGSKLSPLISLEVRRRTERSFAEPTASGGLKIKLSDEVRIELEKTDLGTVLTDEHLNRAIISIVPALLI